jgi:hypothetical protein
MRKRDLLAQLQKKYSDDNFPHCIMSMSNSRVKLNSREHKALERYFVIRRILRKAEILDKFGLSIDLSLSVQVYGDNRLFQKFFLNLIQLQKLLKL